MAASVKMRDSSMVVLCRTSCMRAVSFSRYSRTVSGERSSTIDESRILTEAAIYADKIAVDEETVRLRSHVSQLRGMLLSDEPMGRKMDFLIQEVNRESNTIGSKCNDVTIARDVVALKAEVEKIREQVQNIE